MHGANMKIYWRVLSVAFIRTLSIVTTYNISERFFVSPNITCCDRGNGPDKYD